MSAPGGVAGSESAVRPNVRLHVLAVASAFALNGLSFGIWAARIPAIKTQTGLDDAAFGLALLAASVGAVATMTLGGWLGSRFGTHVVTSLALVGCSLTLPFQGSAWNYPSLALSVLVFGACQGTMDVNMNANGLAVERAGSGPILSKLHGCWSIGSFVGALISSAVASVQIAPFPEFTAEAVFLLVAAAVLAMTMLPDRHAEPGSLRRPSGPLVLLGVLALIGLLTEGSASDWSGIYLHNSLGQSEAVAGLAVTAFAGSMALVSGGAALAAVGLGMALLLGEPVVAIAGFGLMGAGLGAVVPTVFRAAGSQPGIPSSVGIAAVSTLGYAGGLMGPALIGTAAQATSLRMALGIVLALLVVLALASRRALQVP
jgi:MFS family permease